MTLEALQAKYTMDPQAELAAQQQIEQAIGNETLAQVDPALQRDFMMSKAVQAFQGKPENLAKIAQRFETGYFDQEEVMQMIRQSFKEQGKFALSEEQLQGMMQDPNLIQQAWSWFQDLPDEAKMAIYIGVPLALIGGATAFFGEGGFGSMVATAAGLGGVAWATGALDPILPQWLQQAQFKETPTYEQEGSLLDVMGQTQPESGTIKPLSGVEEALTHLGLFGGGQAREQAGDLTQIAQGVMDPQNWQNPAIRTAVEHTVKQIKAMSQTAEGQKQLASIYGTAQKPGRMKPQLDAIFYAAQQMGIPM
jgi:hypothetical protein